MGLIGRGKRFVVSMLLLAFLLLPCVRGLAEPVQLGLTVSPTEVNLGFPVEIHVTLKDSSGNPVSGESIHLKIDGPGDDLETDLKVSNGEVTYTFTPNPQQWVIENGRKTAHYRVTATHFLSQKYDYAYAEAFFTVYKPKTPTTLTLTPSKNPVQPEEWFTLTAFLAYNCPYCTPVPGRTVKFYKGDTFITSKTTNSQGKAYLQVKLSSPGQYIYKAVFEGDTDYEGSSDTVTIEVQREATNLELQVSPGNPEVDETVTFKATLTPKLQGRSIDFYVDQAKVGEAQTNSGGEASTTHVFSQPGSYKVKAVFQGDTQYEGCSVQTSITVEKAATQLTVQASKNQVKIDEQLTITATLKTSKGSPLNGETIYLSGSGINSQETTNSNGQAEFTVQGSQLGIGNHTLTISFQGNGKYKSSSANLNVEVKQNPQPTDIEANAPSKVYRGEEVTVNAWLKSAGQTLTGFILNCYESIKKIWSGLTGDPTEIKWTVPMEKLGPVTINLVFNGDNMYEASNNQLTVYVWSKPHFENIAIGGG